MAQARAPSICFKSITIHKNLILGVGAYGTVCRATCGDLHCAAKVLHPDLILTDQQAQAVKPEEQHRLPMKRFEQECKFLSLIRHPNVILFLGMSQDTNTGLPVLLMELMDENLTTFLERDPEIPLPFRTQVSICHDISSALSFLHSNNIIHRDLSSNNILMNGDRKVKVTDFGMAVFEDAHRKKTEVPGTAAYMPPEVKCANPESSDKTDVFSLGVLSIQIMTRLFPNPVEELPSIPNRLRRMVSGSELEIEKRQNHISMISKDHPLLPIASNCLKYKWRNRPTSSYVCRQIGELKGKDYSVFIPAQPLDPGNEDSQDQRDVHHDEDQSAECEKYSAGKKRKCEHYCQPELARLVNKITNIDVDYEPFEEIHLREAVRVFTPPTQVQDISETIGLTWQLRGQRLPNPMCRRCDAVVLDCHVYMLHGENRTILHSLHLRYHQWSTHPSPPVELGSLAVVNSKVVLVGGKNSNKLYSLMEGGWRDKLPRMPTKRHSVTIAGSASYLIAIGGVGKGKKYIRNVEVMDIDDSCWLTVANFPIPCAGLSACICNGSVYVLGTPNRVFVSSMETLVNSTGITALTDTVSGVRVWENIPELPVYSATCAAVGNTLYAVGGKFCHGVPTTSVYRYNQQNGSWCIYANMKEARSQCFVATVNSPSTMVVVGGVTSSGRMSDTMESASWRYAL